MPFRLSSALLCLQNVAATPISRRLLVLRSRGLLLSLYIKTFFPSVPRVAPSAARNTFIFAVLLQSADSIKFLSGLNTVVFSDCDCP